MILKASQRGHAAQLGVHLLRADENEHVEVHEVRGFMSEDVRDAMRETEAIAKGTKCKQPLFSVSFSPPEREAVHIDTFEQAINLVEERNGLSGQPRIIVFHEKEGRRHAHCVWSRINAETMTAVHLSYYKLKLRDVSRQLYLEHGWKMPRGLMNSKERDPTNFSLDEWQECKRAGRDARELKAIVQECWAASDTRQAFSQALEERGLYLARGDRRSHVALTYEGVPFSIARYAGKPSKEIVARLGDPNVLPSVTEARARIAGVIAPKLDELLADAHREHERQAAKLTRERLAMKAQHTAERRRLDEGQKARAEDEKRQSAARMRGGLRGLWDRLTGAQAKLRKQSELEAVMAYRRDRAQRDRLVIGQLQERQHLQDQVRALRHRHAVRVTDLHRDLARHQEAGRSAPKALSGRFDRLAEKRGSLAEANSKAPPSGRKPGALDLER